MSESDRERGAEPRQPRPRSNRLAVALASVGVLLAAAGLAAFLALPAEDHNAGVVRREGAVIDLLGWLPAEDGAGFAVWTAEQVVATPAAAVTLAHAGRLGLQPAPLVLGRSPGWAEQFGWEIGQVRAWAAVGTQGELAVLDGEFDEALIRTRLAGRGYAREEWRGVDLFVSTLSLDGSMTVDGDWAGGAQAVALLEGRLIVARSADRARAAIDAAMGEAPSLADVPVIALATRALAPIVGLMGEAQASLVAGCDPNATGPGRTETGLRNYVFVAYGTAGPGGERRTLVATSYPEAAAAGAALETHSSGWLAGFVNAGGAGGSVDAFGRLTTVSQTDNLLVAEIIQGRDDGWVRAGIRYAVPVCEAALALAPPAKPHPARGQAGLPALERLVLSLPETGGTGLFRAADLTAAGVAPPGSGANEQAIDEWLEALAPLPPFTFLPAAADGVAVLAETLGVPLSALTGIGEARAGPGRAAVGLLIGAWNRDDLSARLSALGYAATDIGEVRHFAAGSGDGPGQVVAAAGKAWTNLALRGDRLWVSADQRELRQGVDEALATDLAAERTVSALLEGIAQVTALEVSGADDLRRRCGTVLPGVRAVAAIWSAGAEGPRGTVAYLLDSAAVVPELRSTLRQRLDGLVLEVAGTPSASSPAPLTELRFGQLFVAPSLGAGQNIVTAVFALRPEADLAGVQFFEGTSGACGLATIL